MLGSYDRSAINGDNPVHEEEEIRDIHAVTPTAAAHRGRRREAWETGSHGSSSNMSTSSTDVLSENFMTMSREFNALVLAGSAAAAAVDNVSGNGEVGGNAGGGGGPPITNLGRIGEDQEETNPLAIVPDNTPPMDPLPSPRRRGGQASASASASASLMNDTSSVAEEQVSLHRVKKEEIETKIMAWQTAEVAKINNRFKRDDAVINGWESEEVQKATLWMKKIERKLEEKRAKAMEKMQNKLAKARQKAEEKRASAEAKRGTKVARILEVANLMRAVGRAPSKRSFF